MLSMPPPPLTPPHTDAALFWDNDGNWAVASRLAAGSEHRRVWRQDPGFGDVAGASVAVAVAEGGRWRYGCLSCGQDNYDQPVNCRACAQQQKAAQGESAPF
jgi:hypothetical protein